MMKILFILTRPPHSSSDAQEGLDALLMGSAFTECGALFAGSGLLQLFRDQKTDPLGIKDFARGFGALADYGVQDILVRERDLAYFGMQTEHLLIPVTVLEDSQLPGLLADYDRVLNF